MTTSVYIHIPFCEHLCTYCDFAKRFYNEEIACKYLDSLMREVKDNYQHERLKTIYIGGGTPSSLSVKNLLKLKKIIALLNKDKEYEFTFEVNPENIDEEKMDILVSMGVNRISMGVESTISKYLKYLGRCHDFSLVKEKIALIKRKGIKNINADLIYAIPNEKLEELKEDLDNLMLLEVNHFSTYSLEIHHNTILGIQREKNIDEDLDRKMYDFICEYLKEKGFNHYEVSNFCKENTFSKHNLVYWENNEYYGFGLGASGYVNSIRYENTRNLKSYLTNKRVIRQENLSIKDKISYELILGFRLINGINKEKFKKKYNDELIDQYNIPWLLKKGYLIDDGLNIKVSYDKIYVENNILEYFV